jgi:hypothetical protein
LFFHVNNNLFTQIATERTGKRERSG